MSFASKFETESGRKFFTFQGALIFHAVRDKERNQLDVLDFKSAMCTIYDEYVR